VNTAIDAAEFRKALGAFATGVTIITTKAADGSLVGLTASSFNSVSLNPPLVLWSLAETAASLPAFRAAEHWAVHVLASNQEELSGRFSKRGVDKFAGLELQTGAGGIPLLDGCTARFECRNAFQYEGGDHIIFVGEVLHFSRCELPPLVFHGGRYAHATRRESAAEKPRDAQLTGSFNEGFLGYLLGRSHFQFLGKLRALLGGEGLSDDEFYVLSTLTLRRLITAGELDAALAAVLNHPSATTLRILTGRGLVELLPTVAESPVGEYRLTAQGREAALRLISAAKAVELEVLERMGAEDGAILKSLLKRLLGVVDPAASVLWQDPSAHGGLGWD
jgi:3-hydroxy-9,10-secoandrosta-1,3,5(10)-triene-9,17-dione monooxygenase reductase component